MILTPVALIACSSSPSSPGEEPAGLAAEALHGTANNGQRSFDEALPHTNGRACATCHVENTHRALVPAEVESRFQADPADPIFNRLDADDPDAANPTYAHLRQKGLIRVTIHIADNLDVVDEAGNVITNADRTVSVWRGVPTIENTALTAPYQSDGREATLQDQALGALRAHSAISHDPPGAILDHIADFEKSVFSSPGVAAVADALADGQPPADPDPPFAPGSDEAAGKALFQTACTPCHGGPSGDQIVNRAAAQPIFVGFNDDGSIQTITLPDGTVVPKPQPDHPDDRFLNIGIAFGAYLRQIPPAQGGIPDPTALPLPHLRLRFYTDATRTQARFDLPPPLPLLGPNATPQAFSVDPGRALISGDPVDFEAFDVPQLRGIAGTAPYFHDNSRPTLRSVVDLYSRFILPFIPAIGLPPVVPPAGPGLPPESLTVTQKVQLVAYLNKI
ncbi:MAG: hypothetical protein U0359_19785 [Byssovorax sp.]